MKKTGRCPVLVVCRIAGYHTLAVVSPSHRLHVPDAMPLAPLMLSVVPSALNALGPDLTLFWGGASGLGGLAGLPRA